MGTEIIALFGGFATARCLAVRNSPAAEESEQEGDDCRAQAEAGGQLRQFRIGSGPGYLPGIKRDG